MHTSRDLRIWEHHFHHSDKLVVLNIAHLRPSIAGLLEVSPQHHGNVGLTPRNILNLCREIVTLSAVLCCSTLEPKNLFLQHGIFSAERQHLIGIEGKVAVLSLKRAAGENT